VTVSVLLLIVSGGLMGGLASSFAKAADLGFDANDTYIVHGSYGREADTITARKQRLRDQLEKLPELSHVAKGWAPPLTLQFQLTAGGWSGQVLTSFASESYFDTVGITLLRGRSFTRQEDDQGVSDAVISESTARRLWPGQDPLGQRFELEIPTPTNYEVVGVVKDVRTIITELDPTHIYVLPGSQFGPQFRSQGDLIFSTRGNPANRDKTLIAVQSAIASVDPSLLPTLDVTSLEDGPIATQRGLLRLVTIFPAILTLLSLTLAAAGIYGVMAFWVSQRTREIGIRMALGATSRIVFNSIVGQGSRPVCAGILMGLAASIPVAAIMRAKGIVLPGSEDSTRLVARLTDPAVYAELALVLAIALLASAIPARRALRVDPVVALRHD